MPLAVCLLSNEGWQDMDLQQQELSQQNKGKRLFSFTCRLLDHTWHTVSHFGLKYNTDRSEQFQKRTIKTAGRLEHMLCATGSLRRLGIGEELHSILQYLRGGYQTDWARLFTEVHNGTNKRQSSDIERGCSRGIGKQEPHEKEEKSTLWG